MINFVEGSNEIRTVGTVAFVALSSVVEKGRERKPPMRQGITVPLRLITMESVSWD
jgi:hypothetical protein